MRGNYEFIAYSERGRTTKIIDVKSSTASVQLQFYPDAILWGPRMATDA